MKIMNILLNLKEWERGYRWCSATTDTKLAEIIPLEQQSVLILKWEDEGIIQDEIKVMHVIASTLIYFEKQLLN